LIFSRIFGFPQNGGNLRHQVRIISEESCADEIARGTGIDRQPVAKSRPAFIIRRAADIAGAGTDEKIHEPAHYGIVLYENFFVTITQVDRPGTDHYGIRPGWPTVIAITSLVAPKCRRDYRDCAALILCIGYVLRPFGHKSSNIEIKG